MHVEMITIPVGNSSAFGTDDSIREPSVACSRVGQHDMDVCLCLLGPDDLVWHIHVLAGEACVTER